MSSVFCHFLCTGTLLGYLILKTLKILKTFYLSQVRDQYGNEGGFIDAAYGKKITINRASEVIHNYLVEHGIDGMMSVYFTSEMDCRYGLITLKS